MGFESEINMQMAQLERMHRTNDFPLIISMIGRNVVGLFLGELRARGEVNLTDETIDSIVDDFIKALRRELPEE